MALQILKSYYHGKYEDAHFYMGNMVVVNIDKSVSFINLERCCNIFEYKYKFSSPLTTIFFARNDWLNSVFFKKLYSNKAFSNSFRNMIQQSENSWQDLFAGEAVSRQKSINVKDEIIDSKLYSRHLYIGTYSGFYDCLVDWDELDFASPIKRHDGKVLFINPAYGTVNISGGEDGFFSSIHELDGGDIQNQGMDRIDEKSIRSSWSHDDIVNYPTNKSVSMIPTEIQKVRDTGRFENKLVKKIDSNLKTDLLNTITPTAEDIPLEDDIQFIFNGRDNIFINTYSGTLKSIGITKNEEVFSVKYEKEFDGPSGRILSVNPFLHGFLIETEKRILLFHKGKFQSLHSGAAINIRTFPGSKRYKNIVLIIAENGIHIYSIFDESLLAAES